MMNGKYLTKRLFGLLVIGAFASSIAPCYSQVNQFNLPGGVTGVIPGDQGAGAVLQKLQREQLRPPKTEIEKQPEAKVKGIEKKELAKDDPLLTFRFQINTIDIKGVTLIDLVKVQALIAEYEGSEGNVPYYNELADKITQLYQDEGYVTSYAFIPPQEVKDGHLMLEAVEGTVDKIMVEGGKHYKRRAITPRITIDTGDHFDVDSLEKDMRQINQPQNGYTDVQVQAVLEPGDEQGETDIRLQVTDQRPYHTIFSFDNMGRRLIGNNRLGVTGIHNNLLGFGDSLFTSSTFGRRSYGLINSYQVPVGSHGTSIALGHAYSNSQIGDEFAALGLESRASIYSGTINQVLWDRRRLRVVADAGMDFKQIQTDINTTIFPNGVFNRDQLRVIRGGITLEEFDRYGSTTIRNEIAAGFDWFGATTGGERFADIVGGRQRAGRLNAGNQFWRYTGSATRLNKMPWNTLGILRGILQLTPDQLVSIEQIQMGGAFTVRGYREGQIIGDQGMMVSGEWRTPAFIFPRSWEIPFTDRTLRDNVQFVGFTDFGATFVNNPVAGQDGNQYLFGVGGGLRIFLTKFLVGRVDLAVPLIRQAPFSQKPRLHFGIEAPVL